MRKRLTRLLSILVLALFWYADASAVTIGGFDASRGGSLSLKSGTDLSSLRGELATAFPGVVLEESDVLTDSFLSGLDVLVIFSITGCCSATMPLSPAEQAAVTDFVNAGGGALIFADNDTFYLATGIADTVNESLIDPFGLDVTGTFYGTYPATVTDPSSSPVTSGPFGTVSSLSLLYPGYFDNLGTNATSLATLNVNGGPFLAVIEQGLLSPTSGGVVLFSDGGLAINSYLGYADNKALILNAVDFAADPVNPVPEPGTVFFLASGIAGLIGYRYRSRKRAG